MGREKKNAVTAAVAGSSAKERHQRSGRDNNVWVAPVPRHLEPLPAKNIKSRHQSYFEIFENKDKKEKRLEFEVTIDKNPPPGFEFVPIGNPELTKACKDLSREQDAMIFIVSTAKDAHVNKLALQMNRVGHHIRRTIVERARAQIGEEDKSTPSNLGEPEPIPETQEEINAQADAALRDLFPRIPNFDRQMIIDHAFKKGGTFQGQPVVGMVASLPLSRRVQLAVLAHIRHNHTRYDKLLKEADWNTARRVVEKTCLDILVKWRGDEETGRDQLDDILREVVVISDDSDDSDDEDEEYSCHDDFVQVAGPAIVGYSQYTQQPAKRPRYPGGVSTTAHGPRQPPEAGPAPRRKPPGLKKVNRGFKRYEAMAKRWEEAVSRNRHAQNPEPATRVVPTSRIHNQSAQRYPSVEIISPVYRAEPTRLNRVPPTSQPFYGEGREHNQPPHPNESPAANHDSGRQLSLTSRPVPVGCLEGMMVERRVSRLAVDSHIQNATAPEKRHHEELKDLLVPSIEPDSPHSGPDMPQFIRQVIRGEPRRPEQVPAGHSVPLVRRYTPSGISGRGTEFYQTNPLLDDGLGPVVDTRTGEHVMSQHAFSYQRERGSYLTAAAPEQARRVYRVREPIEDARRLQEPSVITTRRVVRVHREARPNEFWEPESGRMRELSPHRLGPYAGRAIPADMSGRGECRRIVYGEASASRYVGDVRSPASTPANPPFYEVRPVPRTSLWQGSTYPWPDTDVSLQPPAQGIRDFPPRNSFQELAPVQRAPSEHQQRGYARDERAWSAHYSRTAAPVSSRPTDVKYLYEQPAPNRDVIVLR